jgi:recombinational DNA repair ATPase RecF
VGVAMTIIYKDILDWSKKRPMWQRDALRRLIQNESLSDEDIIELSEICKSDHGLVDKKNLRVKPFPLENQHIPEDIEGSSGSILSKITDIQNVNALINGQCLDFLPTKGLTVVYGDNGSGKTGFVRILRHLCKTRGLVEPIKPNIFVDSDSQEASAIVHFYNDHQDFSLPWSRNSLAPRELSSVAIFDSNAASVYVGKENDVFWLPGGLDLFSKLVDGCHRVADLLKKELDTLESKRFQPPEIAQDTEVFSLVSNLSLRTRIEEIDRLSALSEEEKGLIQKLSKEIAAIEAEDPSKIAGSIRRKISRFNELIRRYEKIELYISDNSVKELVTAKTDMDNKIAAASVASTEQFSSEPLPGIASETWKILWESARKYSEDEVYKSVEFPYLDNAARCVLCQQVLDSDARDRMKRFSDFVKRDAHRKAEELKKEYNERIGAVNNLIIIYNQDDNTLEELKEEDTILAANIRDNLNLFEKIRLAVIEASKSNTWDSVPICLESPKERLSSLISKLEERALKYEQMNVANQKVELERKLNSLKARLILSNCKDQVLNEIDRLKKVENYLECFRDTDTTAITKKNTELTTKVVTDALRDSFKVELNRLGLGSLSVEIEPARGRDGVLKHHVILKSGSQSYAPIGIVSEGEYRCIALASYLAEATTSENVSSIILDDPVCSLDHVRKEKIAERLVDEAKRRQVIIFTHDLVFLLLLQEYLSRYPVKSAFRQICFYGDRPGYCKVGVPWIGMRLKDRIAHLESDLGGIKSAFPTTDSVNYRAMAKTLYTDIRETWESAVEEVFLNGSVKRLSKGVHTKPLEKIVGHNLRPYYERLEKGMSKSSTWSGHDQAVEINQPPPKPDEIESDIVELKSWIKELKALYGVN